MSPGPRSSIARIVATPLLVVAAGCAGDALPPPIERDLAAIAASDTLRLLTMYNSTGYFLYRGEPMGFEYDLIRSFAEERDLVLHTVVARTREELFDRLNAGDGDIVAARLLAREVDTTQVAHTAELYATRPAVVQLAAPPSAAAVPEAVDTVVATDAAVVEVPARLLSRPSQLAGEAVHLPEGSEYGPVLVELEDTITGDIEVIEVEGTTSIETMIRRVARGEFRLTIAPENLGRLKESYYTNIAVLPTIGPENRVVWAVRRNAPALLRELEDWLASAREGGQVDGLYRKYFVDRAGYQERVASAYLTSETGRLSAWDDALRRAAAELGWDWRLLASQAFQESRFDPDARSWAGAMGLLQLMPGTARDMDVSDPYDPEQNLQGAIRYLRFLQDMWLEELPDDEQRLRFVLASYNAGFGHVQDAQRLATKHGDDPRDWDDVSYWMLQLSKATYYRDPVVEYGFCRGLEPVTYVHRILERFDHYRAFVEA